MIFLVFDYNSKVNSIFKKRIQFFTLNANFLSFGGSLIKIEAHLGTTFRVDHKRKKINFCYKQNLNFKIGFSLILIDNTVNLNLKSKINH